MKIRDRFLFSCKRRHHKIFYLLLANFRYYVGKQLKVPVVFNMLHLPGRHNMSIIKKKIFIQNITGKIVDS